MNFSPSKEDHNIESLLSRHDSALLQGKESSGAQVDTLPKDAVSSELQQKPIHIQVSNVSHHR